jgi:hypothetical protein
MTAKAASRIERMKPSRMALQVQAIRDAAVKLSRQM